MLTGLIIAVMLQLGIISFESEATDQLYIDNQAQIEAIIITDEGEG